MTAAYAESMSAAPLPRCSVIVPAYNAGRYLAETIGSVFRQTVPDWELVVVDDGSEDDTAAVARRFSDPRFRFISQANAGVSAARNRGMRDASAPLVVFLDSDDRLRPDALERFIAALDAAPDAVAAYGEAVIMDESGKVFGPGRKPLFAGRPEGDVLEALVQRNFVLVGAICARRETVEAAGGFQVGLKVSEDWVLWCRLAARGPFVYLGPGPVLEYRHAPASVTRSTAFDLRYSIECIEAVFNDPIIREKLRECDLAAIRRRRDAEMYAFLGAQQLRARHWRDARRSFAACLARRPWSPREWILEGCALAHWLPGIVARNLK